MINPADTFPGLPPDGEKGCFLGFENDWTPHLLMWHPGVQCWASVTFDQPRLWEANLLIRENEGRVVCWARLPRVERWA